MIKSFLLFLVLISSTLMVKSADIPKNEQLKPEIVRSKRCSEGIMKPKGQLEFEQRILESLRRVIHNFNFNRILDYSNDPASNFFYMFMGRSVELKLSETSEESLWEMPFLSSLSVEWHTTAFFLILSNSFDIKEHALVEYFKFISPFWSYETFKTDAMKQAMKISVSKLFLDLFEEILVSVEKEKDKQFGMETLILLQEMREVEGLKKTSIWLIMCTMIVKKFPESVYESRLRIDDFKGEDLVEIEVFIHFLPILSNLMIETRREFEEEQDHFDLFALFHLGDLDAKLPMGVGGLLLINKMFLRSRINLSAFKLELNALKQDLVERIFDAMFLGLELQEMIKFLFENATFSIFESFLKYFKNLKLDETILHEIMIAFIENAAYYEEFNFISALIAYINIPETVWTKLAETFTDQFNKLLIITQYESISSILKTFKCENYLDLKTAGLFEIDIEDSMIDTIAEIKGKPLQLEVARIFLARVCGIPLEITELSDNCNEDFEWTEAVAFINFYIERIAGVVGYNEGDVIKFKVM